MTGKQSMNNRFVLVKGYGNEHDDNDRNDDDPGLLLPGVAETSRTISAADIRVKLLATSDKVTLRHR